MFTVLIVDDESIERNYLCTVFRRRKDRYRVVAQAENGVQAVELAALHQPDIVVMDINIPLLNGLEAAKRIRQDAPERIIILNSAYAEFEFARQAVEYNLDAYLLKPAQEEAIFATVAACLHKKNMESRVRVDLRHTGAEPYPYDIVDRLLEAVASGSMQPLKTHSDLYLNFLKAQHQKLEQYRLYIINTLFSIEQTLYRKGISGNLIALLDCSGSLRQISQSPSWHEIRSITEEFFVRLLMLLESREPTCIHDVDRVAEYIEKNYTDSVTLDDLAALVQLSPAYLSRLFHERKGLTISFYINRRRIERAVCLLQNSQLKIRDIAGDCGFNNLSHFHRVFREQTGKTPVQVRKEK